MHVNEVLINAAKCFVLIAWTHNDVKTRYELIDFTINEMQFARKVAKLLLILRTFVR